MWASSGTANTEQKNGRVERLHSRDERMHSFLSNIGVKKGVFMPKFQLSDERPAYWSELEWLLHHGPNPVNLPQAMDSIQAALAMHTMSYLLEDQHSAQVVRNALEEQIISSVGSMSRRHDEALQKQAEHVQ